MSKSPVMPLVKDETIMQIRFKFPGPLADVTMAVALLSETPVIVNPPKAFHSPKVEAPKEVSIVHHRQTAIPIFGCRIAMGHKEVRKVQWKLQNGKM